MGIVGEAVQRTYELHQAGEYDEALAALRPALDETARMHYGAEKAAGRLSLRFLADNMRLITLVGMSGLCANDMMVQCPPLAEPDRDGYCPLERVLYNFMCVIPGQRCGCELVWRQNIVLYVDKDNRIYLMPMLISALILSVAACPVNKDERVSDACWLATELLRCALNDVWGDYDRLMEWAEKEKFEQSRNNPDKTYQLPQNEKIRQKNREELK